MGGEQLDLFASIGTASARASDPDTSKAAAASMSAAALGAQLRSVLWALDQNDRHSSLKGGTAYDCLLVLAYGNVPPPQQSVIARRLTDLHDAGLIYDTGERRPGSSGRGLIVWRPTDKGRQAIA